MPGRLLSRARLPSVLAAVALVALMGIRPVDASTVTSCRADLGNRMAAFARAHPSVAFAIAVRDLTQHRSYGYRRHARQITASIVKVEILEALLHRHPHGLSASTAEIVRGMIERSDNTDAQILYDRLGDAPGLRTFGRLVGLQETEPGGSSGPGYMWGLTLTSPADQLRLLALLAADNPVLSHGDRKYALFLMRHVAPDQRWGITAGTGTSTVGVKNGWLLLANGRWQVNSIGVVQGPTRHYLIAIQSRGAGTMQTGVQLVDQISRIVARTC
jgi:hypothetical protein